MQRREKGHGAEREREKLEGEGGGGAEETYGQNPHCSPALPEGQLPAGVERSDHKVAAAFPFKGAARLSDRNSRPKKTAKFAKIHYFCGHTREFRGVVSSRISIAQGYCLGIQNFPITITPMGMEIPLGIWFKKMLLLWVSS